MGAGERSACSTPRGARRQRAVKGCSRATLRVRDKGAESDKMEVILQSGCWRAQHDIDQYSRRAFIYTHSERRIYTLSATALRCWIHTENAAAQNSAQRETERERERGLGVCVIYFTLWRPHKDVAQPTAKILQAAAAAVARRRLRNLNCAPYIISPNRTHTYSDSSAQKRSARTAYTPANKQPMDLLGETHFFALVINFYGLTTRAREKTRSIIYKTCVYARRWKCSGGRINDGRKIDVSPFAWKAGRCVHCDEPSDRRRWCWCAIVNYASFVWRERLSVTDSTQTRLMWCYICARDVKTEEKYVKLLMCTRQPSAKIRRRFAGVRDFSLCRMIKRPQFYWKLKD